jgi:hypothetical protein
LGFEPADRYHSLYRTSSRGAGFVEPAKGMQVRGFRWSRRAFCSRPYGGAPRTCRLTLCCIPGR